MEELLQNNHFSLVTDSKVYRKTRTDEIALNFGFVSQIAVGRSQCPPHSVVRCERNECTIPQLQCLPVLRANVLAAIQDSHVQSYSYYVGLD